jgi:polyphosphate kinase 2 (PPK2 family)
MKPREDDQRERAGAAQKKLKGKDYKRELERLHVELVKLQESVRHKGLKICIVFEGRDGAGKGGTIKAITERVSPRVFRVIALPAPTEREQSQMYIQRYLPHLPAAGEIAIFDRSWYNRAGVERVMGFCTEEQATHYLRVTPLVEKAMVDSGIILLKYWLEVSQEEQTRRVSPQSSVASGLSRQIESLCNQSRVVLSLRCPALLVMHDVEVVHQAWQLAVLQQVAQTRPFVPQQV